MKAADLRAKDEASLKDELTGLKKEQFNLRFQQATGQLAKPSRMREVRRDIARLMTVISEGPTEKSAVKPAAKSKPKTKKKD